jgi:hypothetical protein
MLFQPYTRLGWDQNADAPDNILANEVGKFRHIVGFGQPLFVIWSLCSCSMSLTDYDSWKSIETNSISKTIQLAARKLCGSRTFNASDDDHTLAILSQRFALQVCFGHSDAASYIDKGISSHLRVCFSITEDRSWAFTGYPSEPLLSCAAANLLHRGKDELKLALRALVTKVNGGMFDRGQSGELASRLVLLLAKDTYVRKELSGDSHGRLCIRDNSEDSNLEAELIDCQKVSVVCYLQYLFGERFWSEAGEIAKAAFKHAYVNFSHWVPMKEQMSPKDSDSNSTR